MCIPLSLKGMPLFPGKKNHSPSWLGRWKGHIHIIQMMNIVFTSFIFQHRNLRMLRNSMVKQVECFGFHLMLGYFPSQLPRLQRPCPGSVLNGKGHCFFKVGRVTKCYLDITGCLNLSNLSNFSLNSLDFLLYVVHFDWTLLIVL